MKKTYIGYNLYSLLTPKPWYMYDSYENKELIEIKPYNFISKFYKRKETVLYEINQNGFRGLNNINDEVWFFGCSHTFGIGIENQYTFSNIISEKINKSYYNFGTTGASLDLIVRLLEKLKLLIKNKKIIIQMPFYGRYETCVDNKLFNFVPEHDEYFNFLPKNNIEDYFENKFCINYEKIKKLTYEENIFIFSFAKQNPIIPNHKIHIFDDIVDYGYDNNHYGPETNKNIAEFILKNIHL